MRSYSLPGFRRNPMNGEMKVDMGGGRERTVPVNYPSNSRRAREQASPPPETEKKVESVVTGEVVQRKRGFMRQFAEDLLPDDGLSGAVKSFIAEQLANATKGFIGDTVDNFTVAIRDGFHRALWGTVRRPGPSGPGTTYTNYNRVSVAYRQQPSYNTISKKARERHDFDDVILQTRGEAEEVLDGLKELIDVYNSANVGDFYSLLGITPEFTENGWGWYDLGAASIRHVRGGYLISLPQPQPLD
jgi:hypothetical protein